MALPPAADTLSPERRARILEGAARVFAREGYEGASMAGIASETGVSKGTLYNYFPGKAALFTAHVIGTCEQKLGHIFDFAPGEPDPAVCLRHIARAMIEMMFSPIGLEIYRVVVSEAAKFPALARSFFDAGPARAVATMSAWLAEQTRLGRLDVEDPVFAAEQFFGLCQTRLSMRCRLMIITELTDAEIDQVVEGAITMFLSMYGARRPARLSAVSNDN